MLAGDGVGSRRGSGGTICQAVFVLFLGKSLALCSLWVLRVSSNFLWWGTCVCASLWAQVEASIRVGMSSIDSLPCFVERGAHTELELFQQSVQPVSPLGLPIHTPSPTTLRAVLGLQAWASVQTF